MTDHTATFLSIPADKRAEAIAAAYSWSGDDVFDLMCEALTDANFHAEVKALREAYIKTMQFS